MRCRSTSLDPSTSTVELSSCRVVESTTSTSSYEWYAQPVARRRCASGFPRFGRVMRLRTFSRARVRQDVLAPPGRSRSAGVLRRPYNRSTQGGHPETPYPSESCASRRAGRDGPPPKFPENRKTPANADFLAICRKCPFAGLFAQSANRRSGAHRAPFQMISTRSSIGCQRPRPGSAWRRVTLSISWRARARSPSRPAASFKVSRLAEASS